METILNYLDNMFVNMPQTPEVLRAKEDLAEMMEDKYNELIAEGKMQNEAIGIVISEFGNIQELIDELGIRKEQEKQKGKKKKETDTKTVNLNKNLQQEGNTDETFSKETMRHVSDLEADEYLFAVKQASSKFAAGVFLCICSPVLLILLSGIREYLFPISEGVVAGFGITMLLCMVACAVGLFITAGMKMDTYDYLKKERFVLDPAYEQSVRNIWEMHKSKFTFKITTGVILCILSVVPVIVSSIIITESNRNEFPVLVSVACLLVLVGMAVTMFITGGMEEESYKVILQEKEFSVRKKTGKKAEDILAAIYWPVVVIAYLAWSFTTGKWGITWIIWPFAGIIYDVVCKIIESSVHEE